MFVITPSSQVSKLITVLSIVGEFPFSARGLLGNKDYIYNLVYKHIQVDDYTFPDTIESVRCQLFQLSGKGDLKSLRFHKSGLQVLRHLNPSAYDHYMHSFPKNFFRSDEDHIVRNHRIAEAAVMCLIAGIEIRPYLMPQLTKQYHNRIHFTEPVMYMSKLLKQIDPDGFNKTKYARIVGSVFYESGCYAVYNLRDAVMKWRLESELKAKLDLEEICSMNSNFQSVTSAIMFGASYQTGLRILQAWKSSKDPGRIIASVFDHIHYVPIDMFGTKLLRIMVQKEWKEKLLRMFFKHTDRSYGYGDFPYDAEVNGVYVLSFLDSDFYRLYLFRDNIRCDPKKNRSVLCFREQAKFLREYLGPEVRLNVVDIEKVISLMKIEMREILWTTKEEK